MCSSLLTRQTAWCSSVPGSPAPTAGSRRSAQHHCTAVSSRTRRRWARAAQPLPRPPPPPRQNVSEIRPGGCEHPQVVPSHRCAVLPGTEAPRPVEAVTKEAPGAFPLWAITKLLQTSVPRLLCGCTFTLLPGATLRIGSARSQGNCMFNFVRNCQVTCQSVFQFGVSSSHGQRPGPSGPPQHLVYWFLFLPTC